MGRYLSARKAGVLVETKVAFRSESAALYARRFGRDGQKYSKMRPNRGGREKFNSFFTLHFSRSFFAILR